MKVESRYIRVFLILSRKLKIRNSKFETRNHLLPHTLLTKLQAKTTSVSPLGKHISYITILIQHDTVTFLFSASLAPLLPPNTYKPFNFCSPQEYLKQPSFNMVSLSAAVSALGLFLPERPD